MMMRQEELRRPYASPSNVVQVIERARTRNLPETIDSDFLRIAGIGDAVHGRVLDALRFLSLIEENGRPTDTFVAISGASDEEYREILAGSTRSAYEEDFGRIDPASDTQAQIVDAFRRYQPRSQTSRMVMFFLAMCREAGIPVSEAPRERGMRTGAGRGGASKSAGAKATPRKQRQSVDQSKNGHQQTPTDSGTVLGVTVDDIALLDETEFNEVWSALGKVARARARAKSAPPSAGPEAEDEGGQI
jgi:hypothetical protein